MSEPTVEAIRDRLAKATPGPWYVESVGDRDWVDGLQHSCMIPDVVRWKGYSNSLDFGEDRATAEFIANAPTDIAYLLDLVKRYRDVIAALEAFFGGWPSRS